MFGNEFFKNIMICITKFSYKSNDVQLRKLDKSPTKKKLKQEFTTKFEEDFQYTL